MEDFEDFNSVQKFYVGKTIFITGASGFMGKVLLEKLLHSCSEVKEIIILMRPKRGDSGRQRVEKLKSLPVRKIEKMKICESKKCQKSFRKT
jgi:alcohol-forming fatty acyl-CoA reductase